MQFRIALTRTLDSEILVIHQKFRQQDGQALEDVGDRDGFRRKLLLHRFETESMDQVRA